MDLPPWTSRHRLWPTVALEGWLVDLAWIFDWYTPTGWCNRLPLGPASYLWNLAWGCLACIDHWQHLVQVLMTTWHIRFGEPHSRGRPRSSQIRRSQLVCHSEVRREREVDDPTREGIPDEILCRRWKADPIQEGVDHIEERISRGTYIVGSMSSDAKSWSNDEEEPASSPTVFAWWCNQAGSWQANGHHNLAWRKAGSLVRRNCLVYRSGGRRRFCAPATVWPATWATTQFQCTRTLGRS